MRPDVIAQIHRDRLLHNVRALRARLRPGVLFCAPLKADAYGHGVRIVAPVIQDEVDGAAVASVIEALELRSLGWHKPILVLGHVLAVADRAERQERIEAIARHQLTVTVADAETVSALAASTSTTPIDVHLKIDTGMGRMGVMPERATELAGRIRRAPNLRLAGVYSHFATADFELRDMVDQQCAVFSDTLARLGDLLPARAVRHLANSAATITLPEAQYDMVRPGLAMYGYHPADHMSSMIDLRPILRLVSHVSFIKELPAGHCVGYGRTYVTRRRTKIGIVPAGYFEGYIRNLSNTAVVGVGGRASPVIGRISMDQLAIDLTEIPEIKPGDEVVLLENRPDARNSVAAVAKLNKTIPYEVTCLLGQRLQRILVCEHPPKCERDLTDRRPVSGVDAPAGVHDDIPVPIGN